MNIFLPKETKSGEGRFSMCPHQVYEAVYAGAAVYIEEGAGEKSGFFDEFYRRKGARIVPRPKNKEDFWRLMRPDIHDFGQLAVLKVKELLPEEYYFIQPCLPVISFGHLASNRKLTELVIERNGIYVSLEDIVENGKRPVLAGMSRIAGEEAVRIGMKYIGKEFRECTKTIIVGFGTVGRAAQKLAIELGSIISVIDITEGHKIVVRTSEYLQHLVKPEDVSDKLHVTLSALSCASREPILVILAPFVPEKKAPTIFKKAMLEQTRDNSIIVDVSIDQGGACEFSQPTSHENPVIELERGIKYIGIPNLPGSVPQYSTPVFAKSVFPYIMQIVKLGFIRALKENPALRNAVSIYNGKVTSEGLANTFGLEYSPIETLL